jgi:hypothetical protein
MKKNIAISWLIILLVDSSVFLINNINLLVGLMIFFFSPIILVFTYKKLNKFGNNKKYSKFGIIFPLILYYLFLTGYLGLIYYSLSNYRGF